MPYRKIDTGIWADPWFEKLSPSGKLTFIFLWSNEHCLPGGIYKISTKRIRDNLGFTPNMDELSEKVHYYSDKNIVWVTSFFRRQCQNQKFAQAAIDSLDGIPTNLQKDWRQFNSIVLKKYHIDTI